MVNVDGYGLVIGGEYEFEGNPVTLVSACRHGIGCTVKTDQGLQMTANACDLIPLAVESSDLLHAKMMELKELLDRWSPEVKKPTPGYSALHWVTRQDALGNDYFEAASTVYNLGDSGNLYYLVTSCKVNGETAWEVTDSASELIASTRIDPSRTRWEDAEAAKAFCEEQNRAAYEAEPELHTVDGSDVSVVAESLSDLSDSDLDQFVVALSENMRDHTQWLSVVRYGLDNLLDKQSLLTAIIVKEAILEGQRDIENRGSDKLPIRIDSILSQLKLKLTLSRAD